MLQVAAFDRRVKAVVAQVPDISFWSYMTNALPLEAIQTFLDLMQEECQHMSVGGAPHQIRFSAPVYLSFRYVAGGMPTSRLKAVWKATRDS